MRNLFAIAALMISPIGGLVYPSNAGNLGVADQVMIGVDAKNPDYSKKSFKVHPGPSTGMGTDTALAEFKDGFFTIKTDPVTIQKLKDKGRIDPDAQIDESGIRPEQVISFDYHMQAPNVVYTLLYRDTQGKPQFYLSFGSGDSPLIGQSRHRPKVPRRRSVRPRRTRSQ